MFDDESFPRRLAARLAEVPEMLAARRTMAPELSYGRHFGPAAHDARHAAVAILLYRHSGAWHLPLIVRPSTMMHHADQISLPGGQIENDETSVDAAVRELHEELGIAPDVVERLCELSPIYVYASNFAVTPWLLTTREPVEFHPNDDEVAELIELPISALCDPRNRGTHLLKRRGVEIEVPHIAWQSHRIWGATSIILGELAALCDDSPS